MELLLHQWGDWPELYRNIDKTEATGIVIIDSQMNYRGKLDTYAVYTVCLKITPSVSNFSLPLHSPHIQSTYFLHFFLGKSEIEDINIFDNMRLVARAGNRNIAILQVPTKHDLRRSFFMSLGNFPDSFIVEDFLCVAPPAQRIPRFYDRTVLRKCQVFLGNSFDCR